MESFTPIEIDNKSIFSHYFAGDPPQTSELTFTNLFMWRRRNRPRWREWQGMLLIVMCPEGEPAYGLPPTGPGDKEAALSFLMDKLRDEGHEPQLRRVSRDFVDKYVDRNRFQIVEDRDHSDYVYRSENLIKLSGKKYHKKKNHVNKFVKNITFEYHDLNRDLITSFLDLQEAWCELKKCIENPDLLQEDLAIYEALTHFEALDFVGGAILIDGKVEAYALGEMLNTDTAVIHVEKANPDIPGLYATINQRFCEANWQSTEYVNREQDMGVPGLRKAKLSYHPHHLVEKFTVKPFPQSA